MNLANQIEQNKQSVAMTDCLDFHHLCDNGL